MTQTITLHVPDMSCGHCRASITASLTALGATPRFDADRREVTLDGTDAAAAITALARVGFEAVQR